NACEDTDPEKPLVAIAIASTTEATISTIVNRLMGVRLSFRSVRYQGPRNRALYAAPRNAAPASSWNRQIANDCRPVEAIGTSVATDSTVATIATTRPAGFCRASSSTVAIDRTIDVASPSCVARVAPASPGI